MDQRSDVVILIHGLWMPVFVLLPLQRRLRPRGLVVHRFAYPSWRAGFEENLRALARRVQAMPATHVHLVGHSLGGLLALSLLARRSDASAGPRLGRVVLLGSHPSDARAHPPYMRPGRAPSSAIGSCPGTKKRPAASKAQPGQSTQGKIVGRQISSGTILIAPHGHSDTQMPQPLQ